MGGVKTTTETARMSRQERMWQVGELAKAAGVTVRTLHHWDQLQLVCPSRRGRNGYRLYAPEDVSRMYQVLALRGLGLPLAQIAAAVDGMADLGELMRRHLAQVERDLAEAAALRDRLAELVAHIQRGAEPGTGELLELMEQMATVQRSYTREQLEQLAARREQLGPEGMAKAQADWADLIAEAAAARGRGVGPADAEATALARRWHALIQAFTGGDPGVRANLQRVYEEQGPEQASRRMVAPGLMAWMGEAIKAAGLE